jgi:hypothetical protein
MTRVFAASIVVAIGLFGAWMLTSPPVSEAAVKPGIGVSQIDFNAPKNGGVSSRSGSYGTVVGAVPNCPF